MQRRPPLLAALALAALASFAGPASAQDKPPLKILVGFPAGGSTDQLARLLGEALKDDFGSVTVENRPGAAGRTALAALKSAKADGQTVILQPSDPMVVYPHVYRSLDYDAVKDFTPISQIAAFQFGVVSGPATGAKSVADMLAKARANPNGGTYGSPGRGTLPHFMGVLLEQSSGVAMAHIPFQGGAPTSAALLAGHIGYKFDVVSEAAQLHKEGKVRIIAVTGDKRDPQVPEVPTLKESGVNMVATAWFAMYGPAALPPEVLARLERAVSSAVKKPAMQEKMRSLGYEAIGSNSAELAAAQRADLARWEKPIKATGVSLD